MCFELGFFLSRYGVSFQVFGRAEDTFTAVPSHLYYMIREVLKNSCRATVEHGRRTRPGEKLPPVKVGLVGLGWVGGEGECGGAAAAVAHGIGSVALLG